ncbi:hypothetical protein NIES267_45690 [Calothrix parasitica NIES-267]|uniref:Uncharacterized protein n=1 Tax=Calothrix parasitica NIES-267 TaxID=1973488 RepID=A0A1Z4LV81_9CYAN|nr:hypothetical protein NIES267_45690 [Calothrix parasitica NIES-267]
MFDAGDVVTVDFPGVTGIKRRPALVLSSAVYSNPKSFMRNYVILKGYLLWQNGHHRY